MQFEETITPIIRTVIALPSVLDDIVDSPAGIKRNIEQYVDANIIQCGVSIMIARPTKIRIPEIRIPVGTPEIREILIPSTIAKVVPAGRGRSKKLRQKPAANK